MIAQPISPSQSPLRHVAPMLDFAAAMFRASLRDARGFMVTLMAPVMLLVVFGIAGNAEDLKYMLPFTIGLVAMFSGSALAQRIVNWRTQRVFQRLAVTPVPVGWLMLSMVLVQLVLTLLQTIAVMAAGMAWAGITLTPGILVATLGFVALGTLCFLGFGAMLATFATRSEAVNSLYTFTLLPMSFLGGSVVEIPLLGKLGEFFPTTMFTRLLAVMIGKLDGAFLPLAVGGLVFYTLLFGGIALKRFRWE